VETDRGPRRGRGVGDRDSQTVADREARASLVVVEVPHTCILPQTTPTACHPAM
jgi:hypothetical protein